MVAQSVQHTCQYRLKSTVPPYKSTAQFVFVFMSPGRPHASEGAASKQCHCLLKL